MKTRGSHTREIAYSQSCEVRGDSPEASQTKAAGISAVGLDMALPQEAPGSGTVPVAAGCTAEHRGMLPDLKSAPADRYVAAPVDCTFADNRVVSSAVAPLVDAPDVAHIGVGAEIDVDVVAHAGVDTDVDVVAIDADPTQGGQSAAGYAACQRMCLDFGHVLAGSAVVGTAALVAGPIAGVGRLDTVVAAAALVVGKLADVVAVVGLAGSMAVVRTADFAAVPEGTDQGRDPGPLPFLVPGS